MYFLDKCGTSKTTLSLTSGYSNAERSHKKPDLAVSTVHALIKRIEFLMSSKMMSSLAIQKAVHIV